MKSLKLFIGLLMLIIALPTGAEAKKKRGQKRRYPLKVNARPLILPQGMSQVSGALSITSVEVNNKSINSSMLGVGFAHGITKGLEVGGTTGLNLSPDLDWNSGFGLRGAYKLAGKRKGLSLAAQVEIPLTFSDESDVLSGLSAGVATRYRLNKMWALHTGENILSLSFGEEVTTRINVPIGVAIQVNKRLNLRADTRLFSGGSGNTVSIADAIPMDLRALYAIRRIMDAGIAINTDLINDSGFSIIALFSYRIP